MTVNRSSTKYGGHYSFEQFLTPLNLSSHTVYPKPLHRALKARQDRGNFIPESSRMPMVFQMSQFMDNEIVHYPWRNKHTSPVISNNTSRRTGSPPRRHITDSNLLGHRKSWEQFSYTLSNPHLCHAFVKTNQGRPRIAIIFP